MGRTAKQKQLIQKTIEELAPRCPSLRLSTGEQVQCELRRGHLGMCHNGRHYWGRALRER